MALRKTQEGGADIRLRVDPVPSTQKMTKKKRSIAKMKQMKKLASLLLALVMTLALSVSALAAGNGSITIQNPITGETYKAYLMFELESYNTTDKAYSYKITEDWREFVTTGFGKDYFTIDTQDYVTQKTGEGAGMDIAALAKAALEYAQAKKLTPAATLDKDNNFTASDLTLGYYLIDSSLGALCGLTTTQPSATIAEKNQEPTVDKEVKEGTEWGEENDASIGDTVEFRTTIHAKAGAKGYILHDTMTAGLTLNQGSITVKVGDATLASPADYSVKFDNGDKCAFEITFTQTYLDKITGDTDIVVTYAAILNDKAVISTDANLNQTKLNYGDESKSETEWDETKTYTYKFDLVKTKADNTLLTGAEFKLYDAKTGGNEIALVKEADGTYRVATGAEKNAEGFQPATIEAGSVTIKGLDSGTYYLEETKAPAGYNVLPGRVEVKIEGANLNATVTDNTWTDGGVHVINQTGTELPSTGGIGTTIFYVLGSVLVVAAGVLLVTKKRMDGKA